MRFAKLSRCVLLGATLCAACGDDDPFGDLFGGDGGSDALDAAARDAATGAATRDAATRDAAVVVDAAPSMDAAAELDAGADMDDAGVGCVPDLCNSGVELAESQHYVPAGMCARAVALNQGKLRQLAFAPNGDLFGVTIAGEIRRYRDVDCDGRFASTAPEQVLWASTGGNGNNIHIDSQAGYLYAGTPDGVSRWRYSAAADSGTGMQSVVTGQPTTGRHTYATVHVFDGWLYVQSGSADNVDATATGDYNQDRSLIKRFNLANYRPEAPFEWQDGEVFAVGLRNTVGFARDPNGALYGVVNGIDDLHYRGQDIHQANPGEMITRIEQNGKYGFPFCFPVLDLETESGQRIAPGTQLKVELGPDENFMNPRDDAWCQANARVPESLVDAHSAPLDITFMDRPSTALPAKWRNGAFVSLHGSWNRTPSTGYKVIWVPWNAQGRPELPTVDDQGVRFTYEVVFGGGNASGPRDGTWGWSSPEGGEEVVRPVGVAVSPADGALYVSSDNGTVQTTGDMTEPSGAIYRIALR